jgi:hypothetical protein
MVVCAGAAGAPVVTGAPVGSISTGPAVGAVVGAGAGAGGVYDVALVVSVPDVVDGVWAGRLSFPHATAPSAVSSAMHSVFIFFSPE